MTPRGLTRLKMWLVVLGVFLLGGVTGFSLDSLYRLRGGGGYERRELGRERGSSIFAELQKDLSLSEQQATDIRAIIEQSREEYRALRNEMRPRSEAVRAGARARIRALLNPEQQQRFDARNAERDSRREEGRRREQ